MSPEIGVRLRFAELAPEEPTPPRRLRLRKISRPICGTLPKTLKQRSVGKRRRLGLLHHRGFSSTPT
jgi:hypothetical protein